MWEVFTLLGFDGLNLAGVVGLKHDTSTILRINEGEASTIALQMTERIDEIILRHAEKLGNGSNIRICKADVSLPATAGTTTLASVYNRG